MHIQGLTSVEASKLLEKYGNNSLEEGKKESFIARFIKQFNNVLTLLLIGAGALSFFIGEPVDGGLILLIVVLNAIFGLYQEAKAESAIEALKKITVTNIRVIRDGLQQELNSQLLVPGDVCFIEEGVKIPADGIIIESMNLEINEATLTGESLPVSKKQDDEIWSGTIVSKGRGLMKIAKTGMQTKFGAIAAKLSSIDDSQTPLQKKLEDLTRLIGIIGIVAAAVVFVISLVMGEGYFPAFLLAISLAVAVVPEGLPAVMTITLSVGVNEMSRRKSIIRRLSAIEALGSATLIATDKTGTLTTNKMKVTQVYVDDRLYDEKQLPSFDNHPFSLMVKNGMFCSTASLVYKHDHGTYDVLGDPTEGALLFLAKQFELDIDEERKKFPAVKEAPFDSVTKRMSVLIDSKEYGPVQYTKGAPESILEIASSLQKGNRTEPLTSGEKQKIEKQIDEWARKGLRVLAFAYGTGSRDITDHNLIFLGMVAIHDAPRPEVRDAVERAKRAGIKIVMITGDNEKTAEAIGVTAGIIKEGDDIMTGHQLESYSDEELLKLLPTTRIFARTTPFHKHRIVKLYQQLGEIVVVTGDGVNDAIALKQADVGVAMGLVGTDVARETADMVITDDNFASIVNAVEEGRNIIKNLKNAIKYLLSCNITEALTLIFGLLFGFNHILYPIQLLYINLVTDGLPALTLAFSPRSRHLMDESPEKELTLLKSNERQYIMLVGVVGTIIIFASFLFVFKGKIAYTAAFSILTMIQSFILIDLWLTHRSLHRHVTELLSPLFLFAFGFPLAAQFFILRFASVASWFKAVPVSLPTYLLFVLISSFSFVGIKLVKKLEKIN